MPDTPETPPPNWDAIPASLAIRQQWLLWKFEWRKADDDKPQKIPYYVSGGRRTGDQGSDRDLQRLATLAVVRKAYERGEWSGIGFAFLPGDGLIGIDLDKQQEGDPPTWSERCRNIVDAVASYTEISPSGKGVHIIAAGETRTNKDNGIGVEVFCGSQYFTFTGNAWPGSPTEVQPIAELALRRLHKTIDDAKEAAKLAKMVAAAASRPAPAPSPSSGADDFALVNGRAMSQLSSWVPQLLPMAKPYKGGYRVTSKALGRDLQEDLAIHPDGIQDFGLERTFTPIDLVMEHKAFAKASLALHWLAPLVGIQLAKPGRRPPPPPPPPAQASAAGDDDDGEARAEALIALERKLVKHRDRPLDCRENVLYCLTLDPDLAGLVRKNAFTSLFERSRPAPWGRPAGEWDEEDDLMLGEYLLQAYGMAIKSKSTLRDGVVMAARANQFNPIIDRIKAETWDRQPRLDTWLPAVFGVEDREYTRLIGRFFFLGLVHRALHPGCKFDYMLILKGEQGLQKSGAWRAIAHPWFTDNAIRVGEKDSQMAQQLAWIVESAELESLNKSESTLIKQHLSAQEDWFRPPYGSQMVRAPRHSVHVGTTNADTFLRDATGDRRFWPLEVTVVHIEVLKAMAGQLLAEALVRVEAGERYWPTREEEKLYVFPEQEPFKRIDPWADMLEEYVNASFGARAADVARKNREFFPTTELYQRALNINADRIDGNGQMDARLSVAMKLLGFVRHRETIDGRQRRGWMRHKATQPPAAASATKAPEVDDDLPF